MFMHKIETRVTESVESVELCLHGEVIICEVISAITSLVHPVAEGLLETLVLKSLGI